MLVELPDAASILTGLFIFLIGFIAIITYFKVKLYVNSKKIHKDPAQLERLEYYERQLIDLKIRLDTIDLENVPKSEIKSKKAPIEPTNTEQVEKNEESQTTSTQIVPRIIVMNTPPYLNKMWAKITYLNKMWAKITLVKYLMFHAVSYLNKMWAKITWLNTSCCIQHG